MIKKRELRERKETMAKHVNKKSKISKSRFRTRTVALRGRQPSFQVRYIVKQRLNRPNPDTLAAIKEGRRIVADDAHPTYKTMEELKAALEK